MKEFLITGGTGLVGSHLVDAIHDTDSHITILTRQDRHNLDDKITYVNWEKEGWEEKVPNHIDIVINLAGASLNNRWTDDYKRELMLSRIRSTQALFELFEHKGTHPSVLFNASAVGYIVLISTAPIQNFLNVILMIFYLISHINGKD